MRAMFPHTDARRAPLRTEIVLFRVAIGALVLLRLWLGSRLHVTPKVAPHDDLLFLDQAKALLDGQWLGKLDALTLIKGPFYPLFIAATQVAGIRLIAAEQWFYVASCGLFAVALTPWVPSRWGRALAFAVLAFNPMSFATDPATRVIREGIYPALTLAVLACSIGLVARTAWALGLGFALSAFWLTREEGIWIVPSLLALASIAVLQLRGWPAARAKTLLHAAVIPAFLLVASIDGVIVTNCWKYSVCATTEFSTDWFSSATRALYRVKPRQEKPYYLLPREARERAYAANSGRTSRAGSAKSGSGTGPAMPFEFATTLRVAGSCGLSGTPSRWRGTTVPARTQSRAITDGLPRSWRRRAPPGGWSAPPRGAPSCRLGVRTTPPGSFRPCFEPGGSSPRSQGSRQAATRLVHRRERSQCTPPFGNSTSPGKRRPSAASCPRSAPHTRQFHSRSCLRSGSTCSGVGSL